MPKTKKSLRSVKVPDENLTFNTTNNDAYQATDSSGCCGKKSKTVPIIIVLALIIVAVLAVNKGWLVAAVVNNRPIFRWQLDKILVSRFGKQTLENMVSEVLIDQESKKTGVSVTQQEIDAKEGDILKSFGGKVTLDELLTYQGMTKEEFDSQVRLQLLVSKLLGKDVAVTDQEVAEYIVKNKTTLVASEEGALKEEARAALLDQKVSEKIQPWFTEIRNKAKVLRFL